jgi:hypothetical protein
MKPSEKRDLLYELAKVFYPIFFKSHEEASALPPVDATPFNGQKYTRSWFLNEVFDFTDTSDIGHAIQKLTDLRNLNELELLKATSKETQSTVPQNREELEKLAEERKQQRIESEEKAKKGVQEEIERRKQAFERRQKPTGKAQEIHLNAEEEIKLPTFSDKAKENLDYLIETAKKDPTSFSEKLQETIVKELNKNTSFENQKELTEVNAKQISVDFTDKLVGMSDSSIEPREHINYFYTQNPIHQTASLANPNSKNLEKIIPDETVRFQIARSAQEVSLALENDYSIAKTYLSPVVDKDILNYLYPTSEDVITFSVSSEVTPKTISTVNQEQFVNEYQDVFEENSGFIDLVKDQAVGEIKSRAFESVESTISKTEWYQTAKGTILEKAPFLAGQEIQIGGSFIQFQPGLISIWNSQDIPILASNISGIINFGESNVLLTPVFNFGIGDFAVSRAVFTTAEGLTGQAIGINLGSFGITFSKVATETGAKFAINIATNTATQVLTQAGTQAAVTAAVEGGTVAATTVTTTTGTSALAGVVAGLPGMIVSAVIGFFVSMVPKIAKFIGDHKETFIALLSIPLLIFKIPAAIALSPAAIAAIMALGKTGGLAATIGGVIAFIGASIVGFITQFFLYLGIGLVSTGLLTAFILFIINSGAYITPPSKTASAIENPYIDITKVILPEGSSVKNFENSALPLTVEYKVTINPKKSAMSNIRITYKCQVVKENMSPSCPPVVGSIPSSINQTLALGEEYSFTYKHNFSGKVFEDTLTSDTITVTADILGFQNNVEALASASVVIGNPPDECPNNAWPIAGNGALRNVTQGPFAQGCSHQNMRAEAIDIGGGGLTVVAVHSGIAKVGVDSCYGKYVDIQSTCGSSVFISRYAHLGIVSVSSGPVSMGQTLGISDDTGSCSQGNHLHFDFRSPSGGRVNPPTMGKPYLVRDIPTGCCGNCNP